MLKRLLMPLMLILLLPQFMRAQDVAVYPIDVNAIITPPHGTCLKDYVGSRRFMVNVLLRDMTKRPDDFVVEMSVKNAGGRVVFRSYFGNLSLHPGKPAYLDSEIQNGFISQLFNENNISIGSGYATKCFEEGAYTISFQAFSAYHYPQRRIALSRASATTLFMQSTVQGPYLIYPYNKDSIACSETVINFQWQSANPTGEPLSYQLQVAEVPEGVSANRAFEQNSVLVEDVKNLYHSIYQSVKTEGKYRADVTYAWRVLVNKQSGESHISPVYTFVYCGTPQVPEPEIPYDPVLSSKRMDYSLDSLHIDSVDTVSITPLAYWKNKPEIAGKGYCGIGIEVRKQGQDKWTPYIINTVDTTKFQLSNLSYGTLYEIRGQYIKCGEQDTLYGPYGDTLQFIIPDPNRAADCGDDIPPLTDCGDSKGKIMRVGDTINANGTSVIIDSLSYDEKDSTIITGKGHIEFPIIKNIRLWTKFEKIQINCAGELAKGNIVSIYDPRTAAMIDLEELTGENSTGGGDNPVANSTTEVYSKEKFDAAPAGSFFTKGDTVVMKDGSGNEVIIGREISLSSDEYASRNALADDAHFLEFRNDIDPDNVAFDNDKDNIYSRIDQGKEGYQKFSNAGGRNYIIPWLANNPGKLKPLSVKDINLKGGSLFDSVKFVMPTNGKYIELSCETTGEGEYKIRIPGGAGTRNSFEVYALGKMKGNSSYQDAGKLLIANYAPRTQKVIIVPVLKEYAVSPDMEQQLNQIYGRLGVSYEVVVDKVFTEIDTVLIDSLKNGLKIGADDESRWQVETQEMKRLRYSYQLAKGDALDKNAAYIFLVEKAEEPYEGVEGDMPRNQSVGYIFMNGKESLADGRLVAHELGHGVYKLQHTFAYKQLAETKGKTDNLMDYNGGSFLAHYQWRVMQDSVMFVWGLFQDDEDGQKIYLPIFNDDYEMQKLDHKAFDKCLEYAKKIPFFNYCWEQLAGDNDIYKIDVVLVTINNLTYVTSQKSETNGWFSRGKDKEERCWYCWFSEPTKIPAGSSEKNPHTINFIGPSAKKSVELMNSDGLVSSSTMVEEVFHAAHTSYYLKSGEDKKDKDWFDNGSQFIQTEIEVVIMKNLIYFMYYNNLISVDRKDYKEYEDYYKEYKKFHKDLVPYVQNYSILFNDGKYYSEKVHDKFKRLLTSDCTIKDVLWESNKPIDNFQKAISEKQGNEAYSSLDISRMDANMPFLNSLVSKYRGDTENMKVILDKIKAAEETRKKVAEEEKKKAAEEKKKKAAEEKKKNMSNSNKSKK